MPVCRIAREQHRREQHQADLKEHRQADEKAREQHRPVEASFPERRDEHARHDDGAAGLGEQLADDRPEPHDHRDEAERVADALLKRAWNVGERHPRAQPDEERPHGERDEGGDPHPGDEQHDERDAEERDEQ